MRLFVLFAFLALVVTSVLAWEKEDHEIFDLVSAVESAEGKGTTFYSWLNVPSTATTAEISKAYRKKSMQLHPDKNPGVKGIPERFARLGVVGTILRNAEARKRYDFFYKNGVPKWRGTGYYYERFRPGVGSVLVFLVVLTSGLHYLVQRLNYKKDLARIERFVSDARSAAWGPKMIPVEGRRKVKVSLGGQARYDEDGNPINGRSIDMVVEGSGDVFIVESSGDLTPLDESAANAPAIANTWFIALVSSLVRKVTGKAPAAGTEDVAEDESELESDGVSTPNSEGSAATGAIPRKGRAAATTKAGGQRRKTVKRR